jgi:beta-galactosidase
MIVQSRRAFLDSLFASAACYAANASAMPDKQPTHGEAVQEASCSLPLENGWLFTFDAAASNTPSGLTIPQSGWMQVNVPHTWQAMSGNPDYVGVAWYKLEFTAPNEWAELFVRIEFEAVTHTAHVFLNGKPIGEHVGKGYTAFACDLSPSLEIGARNVLLVRVDNRPSNTMLPRNRSYDWTDDGGLIRPVNLLITPRVFIERVEIDAVPHLDRKEASVAVRVHVSNTTGKEQALQLHGSISLEGSGDSRRIPPAQAKVNSATSAVVELQPVTIASPALWHFDSPRLYTAKLQLRYEAAEHSYSETFGIRSFEVRGPAFYLNGERVSLMGVERMAGSNPDFGMAETTEWIESNHRDLKELNCVFTRVHWAQDKRVLDFCDRNGILMQEEVPAWGPETFRDTTDEVQRALEQNGLEQLREMVARDRNHPCIVSWGLCNEVDGKNPRSRQFAHVIANEARKLDPSRLLTYASHSLGSDPGSDMAVDFDFISTNEYYGSWTPGGPPQVRAHLERIRDACPSKPIVVSEYGWCECQPSIMPGDDNRVDIVNSHTEVFREFSNVAGAIYFDYNDYRTLVGDKGTGAMKQRVHGVVDLYARRKPSFLTLQNQSSPIERLLILNSPDGSYRLVIEVRKQLPGYLLRGYHARWIVFGYDDLPMHGAVNPLPELQPGESHTIEAHFPVKDARRIVVDILRPTGFSAARVELPLQRGLPAQDEIGQPAVK